MLGSQKDDGPSRPPAALEENVATVKAWESATILARSKAEQIGDWVACKAASGPVLLLHLGWLGNVTWLPNRWGVDWLLQEVWPRLRAARPEACLRLAGVENIRLRDGPWHAGAAHSTDQTCMKMVEYDVNPLSPYHPVFRL